MEVENHNDSLTSFDILEPFEVSFVDDQGSLHIGNGPMPGNRFITGLHETNRFHFDAHHLNQALFALEIPEAPPP